MLENNYCISNIFKNQEYLMMYCKLFDLLTKYNVLSQLKLYFSTGVNSFINRATTVILQYNLKCL